MEEGREIWKGRVGKKKDQGIITSVKQHASQKGNEIHRQQIDSEAQVCQI